MHTHLGTIHLELASADTSILEAWGDLLTDWPVQSGTSDVAPHLTITLELTHRLPSPVAAPFYTSQRPGVTCVQAYRQGQTGVRLYLGDFAVIDIPDTHDQARAWITPAGLSQGQQEDVTYQAMAPLLRQRGYLLIHAACARLADSAILLVGASGSGKTTSGLNLALHGWQILANDVTLLDINSAAICAWPTPDQTVIRRPTLALLPALQAYLTSATTAADPTTTNALRLTPLAPRAHLPPTPVGAICFPQTGATLTHLTTCGQGIALARLLEESLDCWDTAALPDHTRGLSRLARQAPGYHLHLGTDTGRLPPLLAALLADETPAP